MPWCYVDDHFPDHPKTIRAGGDAGWLWVCAYAWAQRNLTGGRIPKVAVASLSDRKRPMALAKKLVEVGLWEEDGDDYVMHDYVERNPSAEKKRSERDEAKGRRSEAGRVGAMARWHGSTASESHATGDAIAPEPHANRTGFASFGGAISHANGAKSDAVACAPPARSAPAPIPQSPNPYGSPSRGKPPGVAVAGASEMEMDQEKPQVTEPELARWLTLWPPSRQAEARAVWDELLDHVAPSFLGQVVGGYCMPPKRMRSPNYLRVTALNQALDQGILYPDNPVFATLDNEAGS